MQFLAGEKCYEKILLKKLSTHWNFCILKSVVDLTLLIHFISEIDAVGRDGFNMLLGIFCLE